LFPSKPLIALLIFPKKEKVLKLIYAANEVFGNSNVIGRGICRKIEFFD